MAAGYRSWPYVFLDNDPTALWNDQLTTELLPLLDIVMDNLHELALLIPSPLVVKAVISLFGSFSRYISANQSSIDESIRVRYNDWLNEFLPSLGLSKLRDDLIVDLPAVSM